MAEYRVDELARAAETSVRNVRVYQDRGLLPPPRRVGRAGVYTEIHLARLRLIRLLLHRGYTFATIGELITALSAGQGLAELIGLDDAIAAPWSDESPRPVDAGVLDALGDWTPADLERGRQLGLLAEVDGSLVALSPRLLEAGIELVAAGIPLHAVLDLAEQLQGEMDAVADILFRAFDRHMLTDGASEQAAATSLLRLRPFADQAVSGLLALAMTRKSERMLARRRRRLTLGGPAPAAATGTTEPAAPAEPRGSRS